MIESEFNKIDKELNNLRSRELNRRLKQIKPICYNLLIIKASDDKHVSGFCSSKNAKITTEEICTSNFEMIYYINITLKITIITTWFHCKKI